VKRPIAINSFSLPSAASSYAEMRTYYRAYNICPQ